MSITTTGFASVRREGADRVDVDAAPGISSLSLVLLWSLVLGMGELGTYTSPDGGGHVTILDAGRATLELADSSYAAYIDQVEVGQRVAGPIRVALEVDDAAAATGAARDAGARVLAEPTTTPWNSSNARLQAPAGLQITLLAELGDPD